jgi:hypothetical protein
MPIIDTYLSNKAASPEQINSLLKYKLQLNFYGFLLELNFAHLEDITLYKYYFNYFINQFSYINSKLATNWIADSGRQAFSKTLENTQYLKEVQVILNDTTFSYDRFRCQPSQPSLIPPLHLSPFCEQHIGFHGAAVARNQKSILIFGKNNSGKSTYSINLILNGYKLLSDDTIIYDAWNNQVRAFPRPIGLREGTLKAHPQIKNLLYDKQLIRYKAVDYTHLMIYPEELFPGCIVDYAEPYAAFFLNHVSGQQIVTLDEVDKSSLDKLLRHFSYYPELNPNEHSKNLQALGEKLLKVYIISLDIRLTDIEYLIEVADRFLKK